MTDKFGFIEAERAETEGLLPPVDRMCALLEVSKSGYHQWRGRPPSEAARRRELLADKVRALFEAFHRTYGYRRVHAELVRGGERVGRGLVAKLMAEMGLVPVQPRPFRKTTEPDPDAAETVDLVKRDFSADRPGSKVVGDITYIRTWQGWLYLATLIDCATREVVGHAIADHMRTDLILAALDMAARNGRLEPGCIMHSDRGSQYTSGDYRKKLGELGLRHSVGRRGQCWDNALAESFFATLKNERVYQMVYPTKKGAAADIAQWIELFYNHRRIHSALGYRTPHEVRVAHLNTKFAA